MKNFLNRLHIDGKITQVGELNKVLTVSGEGKLDEVVKNNTDKNLYFLSGIDPRVRKSRACDRDVSHRKFVVFDLDIRSECKEYGEITDEEIKQEGHRIGECLESVKGWDDWSYIIFTGNGIHIYYIGDTIPNDDLCYAGIDELFKKFDKFNLYPCDKACKNAARILRLPGSYNNKQEPKLVEILAHKDRHAKMLSFVREAGKLSLEHAKEAAQMKEIKFSVPHESTTFDAINKIPIGGLVARHFGWNFDGRNFNEPNKSKQKACFVPKGENFLVQGGTDHVSSSHKGYSPFTFIKEVLSLSDADTFKWFTSNFKEIEDIDEKSRRAFGKKGENIEVIFTAKPSNNIDSFTWGSDTLDGRITTIKRKQICVLFSDAGQGKSTFCFHVARRNVDKYGHRVVYFNLEQTKEEIFCTNAQNYAGISDLDYRDNKHFENVDYLSRIAQLNAQKGIEIIGTDVSQINKIESVIERVSVLESIDMLIVDNLSCLLLDTRADVNTQQQEIILKLTAFAKKANVPIILVHHSRKAKTKKTGRFSDISDMLGSGSIKNLTHMVIQISRDTDATDLEGRTEFHLKIHKNRTKGHSNEMKCYYYKGEFYNEFGEWESGGRRIGFEKQNTKSPDGITTTQELIKAFSDFSNLEAKTQSVISF